MHKHAPGGDLGRLLGAKQIVNQLIRVFKALIALLVLAQIGSIVPVRAAESQIWVHIRVFLYNRHNGGAVPSQTVNFHQNRTAACPTGAFKSVEAGPDGVAEMYVYACLDTAALYVDSGNALSGGMQQFTGAALITVARPNTNYNVRVPILAVGENPNYNSNKYLNQDRVLHIRVLGITGGKRVEVHNATIYDLQNNVIAHADWHGIATVRHKEVLGESVTLVAEASPCCNNNESWKPTRASFIVGASEGTVRSTIPEDHITFVLNGDNENVERHPLDVIVRGDRPGLKNRCQCVRVGDATIFDEHGHVLGTTNSVGEATVTVEAPLGEEYTVKVEAKHWKPASERLQSGSSGNAGVLGISTYAREHVEFRLQSAQEHGDLTVEVLDKETDKPVHGVDVILYKPDHYPGTVVGHEETSAQGEAVFNAQDVDEAMLNGEARVEAKHGGWESTTQTISEVNGEAPRYLIYIKQKTENTKWSGTWYSGPYTIQISGGTGSLGYQFLRSEGVGGCCPLVDQGSGNCTVHGNVAMCKENSHYHDSAKDVQRSSVVKLTLSGETIASVATVKTASITLSSGQQCPDIAQCTGMHPGAEFDGTWTRKKP